MNYGGRDLNGYMLHSRNGLNNQTPNEICDEEREICLISTCKSMEPIIPLNRYSAFSKLQRVTAWMFRFANNCRTQREPVQNLHLSCS